MEEAFLKKVEGINNIENCYNITTNLIPNCIEKEYIALISPYKDHLIQVGIFGYRSKEAYFHIVINDAEDFIDGIPKIMDSKIKAVILRVYEFKSEKFSNNVQFCKSLKAKFDAITTKIPYCFISDFNFLITKMLIAANISVNFGEFVLVLLTADKFVNMVELKYTKAAESKKFIFVEDMGNFKYNGAGVIEESKWIFNKKYTKFHVLPTTARAYVIGFECGEEEFSKFMERNTVALPYEKTVIAPKSRSKRK
uniref:Uncharacterized protein n=1 Tax=Panagrolaimus sp. PS1159 TaxID=55785 RepID=A0AC35G0C0_9BILA